MTIMSRQLFGARLGAFGEPMISPVAAPFVGAVLAGLTTLGIRMFAPVNDKDGNPGWWYKYAPAVGFAAGAAVGGGASYFLGGEDTMTALTAVGGALLPTAPMFGQEAYVRHLAGSTDAAATTRYSEIMAALNQPAPAAALPENAGDGANAGTAGVGNVRYIQGRMSRYGQSIYSG